MLTLLVIGMLPLTFSIQPVSTEPTMSAMGPAVHYKGTCDTWYRWPSYGDIWTDVKIVEGYWEVKIIKGDKAIFSIKYTELNIDYLGESGTYVYWKSKMTTDNVTATPDGFIINGTALSWENGVFWDTEEIEITINKTNYETQFIMYGIFDSTHYWITGSLLP